LTVYAEIYYLWTLNEVFVQHFLLIFIIKDADSYWHYSEYAPATYREVINDGLIQDFENKIT